jgi:hypothetical protein
VALEQLIPANHLRIAAVADLYPGRIAVLRRVPAVPVLGDNPLQVTLADQFEQALAFSFDSNLSASFIVTQTAVRLTR